MGYQPYEIVCGDCRKKQEELYKDLGYDVKEENKRWTKWINSLCDDCKKLLKEEGWI